MISYASSEIDHMEFRKEEEFLDSLPKLKRFIKRLDEENITGVLKQHAITNFVSDKALQCGLRVV